MAFIEYIVMNNCRLCHKRPGKYNINSDKKFVKEIYDCVKVKVNDRSMDMLPHCVCEECKTTIKDFFIYKQQVKKVDQSLRKILSETESPKDKDTSYSKLHSSDEEKSDYGTINDFDSHDFQMKFESNEIEVKNEIDPIEINKCENEISNYKNSDCKLCKQKFNTIQELKLHKKSHKRKFVCSWKNCQKILTSAYTLKTHELKHEGKRSFLCVTCGKGFITKNSLTCHEKIHLDIKGYTCKLCNIGFSVRSNLRAHEKKHHEGIRFYCSKCTKAFVSKCSLERHERIHTGIKDFQCESCPSAFYTNKELVKHQRYHQGLRLHKCDQCFKTFFERHHLVIHLRSHTGERPYVCKVPDCGKSFMESQKLKRHHNAKHAQT